MKKTVLLLFVISFIIINKKDKYIIPSDAIRFRIVANSNSIEDQTKKSILKVEIENKLKELLQYSKSKDDSKNIIISNLDNIKNIVEEKADNYDINYGYNYFPKKEYRNVIYPEGEYESLVVTLGDGLGDNWWCVLYPPLCFIDEDLKSEDYSFYVKEVLDKFNS